MRKVLFLAVLLAPAVRAPFARAADPALVTGVEKYLRDDEKAFLAAVLTNPAASAEFDAGAPLALKDPKNLTPFLGVWRAKLEAYAETDAKGPNPDLEGHYSNYAQLMTAQQRAYMVRRLPTMKEDDRNSLIGYLNSVNEALQKNGTLTWYTKKVVAGIMDHYRTDLNTYVATPMAQSAKRDAAASAEAFAAVQKADADSRVASTRPATKPAEPSNVAAAKPPKAPAKPATPVKPAAPAQPAAPAAPAPGATDGTAAKTPPANNALDQARNAAGAGDQGGQVIDGGGARPPVDGGAVAGTPGGAKPGSALTPSTADGKPNLSGTLPSVPSPVPAEASFMDSISKMQTKPAPEPFIKRVGPAVSAVVGGLLGALIGFFVGGPVGAVIGAAAGAAGGAVAGHYLVKKLLQ